VIELEHLHCAAAEHRGGLRVIQGHNMYFRNLLTDWPVSRNQPGICTVSPDSSIPDNTRLDPIFHLVSNAAGTRRAGGTRIGALDIALAPVAYNRVAANESVETFRFFQSSPS
jgi:hypothetical protein